ncbi:MAG: hypothetical protein Q7R57_04170 [Dehalococcoidales bacterium]|nr:hypothetical protein [Dehalococcoidales bacterium]
MKETKVMLIVGNDCADPAQEKEFNDWYHKHINEIKMTRPGVKRVARYQVSSVPVEGPPNASYPKYLAVYEFDSEESLRAYESHRTQQKEGKVAPLATPGPKPKGMWRKAYKMIDEAK